MYFLIISMLIIIAGFFNMLYAGIVAPRLFEKAMFATPNEFISINIILEE